MLSVFVVCSVFLWYYDMLVLRLTAEGVDMVLFNRDADSDRPFPQMVLSAIALVASIMGFRWVPVANSGSLDSARTARIVLNNLLNGCARQF
jgi:hypothetical protein